MASCLDLGWFSEGFGEQEKDSQSEGDKGDGYNLMVEYVGPVDSPPG